MPELDDIDIHAWIKPWLDIQSRWWETWARFAERQKDGSTSTSSPGTAQRSALFDWYRSWALPGTAAADSSDAWASHWNFFNQMGSHFQDQFWQALAPSPPPSDQTGRTPSAERESNQPWSGLAAFWGMPLDNWRRVCSAVSTMPGDMEQAVRGTGSPYGPESLHRTMLGFLSLPTLGYTREWQEEWQRWLIVNLDYAGALRDYSVVMGEVAIKAAELFTAALQAKLERGEPIEELKGLYDLWIDCAEAAYGELSISAEFVKAQSSFTNALMALKHQEQKMVDEGLSALSMPTRRELDTSHRRVHELQRRVWHLEQASLDGESLSLRESIDALRQEVESLRALTAGGLPHASPRQEKRP